MNNIQLAVFSSWVFQLCSRMQFSILPINQDKEYDVILSKLRSFIESVCSTGKIFRVDEVARYLLQFPFIWYDIDFKFFLSPAIKESLDSDSIQEIEYLSKIRCDRIDFSMSNVDGMIQILSAEKKSNYKNWLTVLNAVTLSCVAYNEYYVQHRCSSGCRVQLTQKFWSLLRSLNKSAVGLDGVKEFLNWLYDSDNSFWYWGLVNSNEFNFDASEVLKSLEALLIEIGDLKKRLIFKRSSDPVKPAKVDLNQEMEIVEKIAPVDDTARLITNKLDSVIGSSDNCNVLHISNESDKLGKVSNENSVASNTSGIVVHGGLSKATKRSSRVRGAMEYAISESGTGGNIETLRDLGVLSRHPKSSKKDEPAVLFRSRLGRTWYYNKE